MSRRAWGSSLYWFFAKNVAVMDRAPSVSSTSMRTPAPDRFAMMRAEATCARMVASSPSRRECSGVRAPQW